jgi:hypothetical protein
MSQCCYSGVAVVLQIDVTVENRNSSGEEKTTEKWRMEGIREQKRSEAERRKNSTSGTAV